MRNMDYVRKMKKEERKKVENRQMFLGAVGVVMTAAVLAGAIKEEVTFVCSVCSELSMEGEINIMEGYAKK